MNSDKVIFRRSLKMDLPAGRSAFLWGPRKTGKTTYLQQKFPKSTRYDLLETDLFLKFSKEPHRLREELNAESDIVQPVIIDEVQKIPALLDEIHGLIEKKGMSFVLCGSSARKLKRSHANMLGGRAWRFELFPLTTQELGKEFHLLQALNRGLIPAHYTDPFYEKSIKAYVSDYLREEIQQEGLVRNLPAFARFMDSLPFSNGEMVNYTNIARECAVDAKTVGEYYQILIDTFVGYFLEPFRKQRKRQIISATPKFYLFDVGVAQALGKRKIEIAKGSEFGKAFEHLVFMELMAYRSYQEKDTSLTYWRTKDGHEVDFVIDEGRVAIEVKGTSNISPSDLKGLKVFMGEHPPKRAIVVCQEKASRKLESGIEIMPWQIFFKKLWDQEIF